MNLKKGFELLKKKKNLYFEKRYSVRRIMRSHNRYWILFTEIWCLIQMLIPCCIK